MRYSKTQLRIISRLLNSPTGRVAVGACDGLGYRDVNAAECLVKQEVLRSIVTHRGSHYLVTGRAVHFFETTYTWG